MLSLLLACRPQVQIDDLPVDRELEGSGNVLILLIDDIGVDKVGAYGSDYAARTPTLDALATQGIRFNNAYAAPLCSPARAQLLTGRHARRTGIGTITNYESNVSQLPLEALTLPEALEHAPGPAWSHGAIGKWHLAGVESPDWAQHPNRQGFQHFAGTRGNPVYQPDWGYFQWYRNVNGAVAPSETYLTTGSVDDALARIEQMEEPWLLYVAFNSAHVPLHRPPDHLLSEPLPREVTRVQRHDAMVEALDTEMGRLLTSIDPEVLGRTSILTLGDNGTSRFGLAEGQGPPESRIKHSVYQGGVRVPFLVNGPHVTTPGSTHDALVHITDLFPTVLDLAGVPTEGAVTIDGSTTALDGLSILPLLAGEEGGHETIYAERFEPNGAGPYVMDRRSLRSETHELVRNHLGEQFFRIDGWWEGPELLAAGPLADEDADAFAALTHELDRLEEVLVYEGR